MRAEENIATENTPRRKHNSVRAREKAMKEATREEVEAFEESLTSPPAYAFRQTITPGLAAYMLKHNTSNRRPVAKRHIYADMMAAGEWFLTGDTIKFATDLTLLDGQNRLLACVQAKVPFETFVVFGIDRKAFQFMDRGKLRSAGDTMSISGVPNASRVACAVRWVKLLEMGRAPTRDSFEPAVINAYYLTMDAALVQKSVHRAEAIYRAYPIERHPVGILAAMHYHFSMIDERLADEFFEAWLSGRLSGRFAPLDKMLRAIREQKAQAKGRLHEVTRVAHIITAWNLIVQRKAGTVAAFNWTFDQKDAGPFPTAIGAR